jgi:hypothetical protein
MRGEEVASFWSGDVPDRRAHFHNSGRRTGDTLEQVILEVLVSVKTRRQPIIGLHLEGLGDGICLRDLVSRVAERGAQNHDWHRGDVALVQSYYLISPGEIFRILADIHRRFRCIVVTNLEGWESLEAEVSLTQVPKVVSIARPCENSN